MKISQDFDFKGFNSDRDRVQHLEGEVFFDLLLSIIRSVFSMAPKIHILDIISRNKVTTFFV